VIAIAIVLCSTAAPPAPSLIMKDRLPQACAAPPRDAFLACYSCGHATRAARNRFPRFPSWDRETSMARKATGLFQQPAIGNDEAVAYVASGDATMFVTESEYRVEGVSPPFETLPTQDEYEAAREKEDIEATEDEDVASHDRRSAEP
jgi:hypothetical protein